MSSSVEHCIVYTIHYTVCPLHYTLYTVHCTPYSVQCTRLADDHIEHYTSGCKYFSLPTHLHLQVEMYTEI